MLLLVLGMLCRMIHLKYELLPRLEHFEEVHHVYRVLFELRIPLVPLLVLAVHEEAQLRSFF